MYNFNEKNKYFRLRKTHMRLLLLVLIFECLCNGFKRVKLEANNHHRVNEVMKYRVNISNGLVTRISSNIKLKTFFTNHSSSKHRRRCCALSINVFDIFPFFYNLIQSYMHKLLFALQVSVY